jgi:tape measure domain-containing protein
VALNGSIVITTKVETGQATASLDGLKNRIEALEKAQDDAAKSASRQAEQTNRLAAASNAAGVAVGIFAAAATAAAIGSIKLAADLEQAKVAFTTLLGSGEKAKKFLDELAAFAAATPFEFKDLQDSSRRLLAFGFAAKDIIPIMNAVGSAVAGLGGGKEQIDRVTLALGQMQAKGKVSAEEMNQIAELGVPGWQMIAKAIGTSIPEAMKLAEKGAIDSTTAINALITGMTDKFPGMLEKQSQTINGQLSNLRDGVTLTATLIGERLISAFHIAEVVGSAARAVSGFAQVVKTGGLREAIDAAFPPGLKAIIIGIAGTITAVLLPALGAAVVAAAPFLAIGAGIAAAAYLVIKNWTPVSAFFGDLFGKIGRMAEGLRDTILRALGKPIVELGTISRTSMRLSQAGGSIKPTSLEAAAAQPSGFLATFKNMLSDFVPDLSKFMQTTVTTVANTAFTGLSGKAPAGAVPAPSGKATRILGPDLSGAERRRHSEQVAKDAQQAIDHSKKLEADYRAWQYGQDQDAIDRSKKLETEYIAWQADQDRKALAERERLERETQQRTATGLRETYGVALNLLRGDFEGVAVFFRGKLEESIVNALSQSPAVQNAIAQLGSAFTGPLGIAALFGSLLVSSVLSAGEQARKIVNQIKTIAEEADRIINPEKYRNENPEFVRVKAALDQAIEAQRAAEDAIVNFQKSPAFYLDAILGGGQMKELRGALETARGTVIGLSDTLSTIPQKLMPGQPGYTGLNLPTFTPSAAPSATTAPSQPVVMPGETPDKPIYTQVVNVRDFRDAFPDSAYFRAPSVDTTRSLNANAVAYR